MLHVLTIEEVISKLEEDAELVLKFMASNGLVANPSQKTSIMILNYKNKDSVEIWVGDTKIKQEHKSKLLGNNVPDTIKNASTLYMAKIEINKYCATFPM